jgi:hypothetical protein
MKTWYRIVLLVSVLVMANFANVYAWPPENGTCYVICDGGRYPVSASSSWECCTHSYPCPDNSSPTGLTSWEPDEGWPILCPPYGD